MAVLGKSAGQWLVCWFGCAMIQRPVFKSRTSLSNPLYPAPLFSSWQSVISLVCCLFDHQNFAYDFLFLVLGGGTLFGGLLVAKNDIPFLFKPIYYLSVTAVTQRALIVNDFLCCYLTASCVDGRNITNPMSEDFNNNIATDLFSQNCPAALEFIGDGSDKGNLGRLTLQMTGLSDVDPFIELATIFSIAVCARILAVLALVVVEKAQEKLKEVEADETRRVYEDILCDGGMTLNSENGLSHQGAWDSQDGAEGGIELTLVDV